VRAGAGGAWFLFEGPDGGSDEVEAREVAAALKGRGVRAVVLSARETGKAGSEDLSAGFATPLLAAGVPVVVGMAESVYDQAGMVFARALADALAAGTAPRSEGRPRGGCTPAPCWDLSEDLSCGETPMWRWWATMVYRRVHMPEAVPLSLFEEIGGRL
jgi:hypothetical protein